MKKLLCIIICILTAFCFVGCKDKGEPLSDEPPLVELMARALSDENEFAIVDEKGTVWLENDDVTSVVIMYKRGQNRYLELRFTKEGAKSFKQAVRKTKNGTLNIMLNGELLACDVTANQENPEYARVDSKYEEVIDWFNKLT